ncbi:MAG: ATP-binding protein [Cytophagales bacterium]
MENIVRNEYMERLWVLRNQNLIKVVTGVRRCGKSTIMLQFQEKLLTENPTATVLSINFDVPEYRFLAEKSWKEVYDFVEKSLKPNVKNYVFLDEVQNVTEFEKLLEGLYVHPQIDLYVTGSNAYLLSSELATLLTGRAFEINVLPFSFAEYVAFTGNKDNLQKSYSDYVQTGGFPEAIRLSRAGIVYANQYVLAVYQNIFQNDIQKRHKVYHEEAYLRVVNFLIDSVGSSVSATNIANVLSANGNKITNKSISSYIGTLTDSYLFYKANRYDIKGRQHLSTQEKYYMVDLGLRNALLGKNLSTDRGHLLENVVYLELIRRNNQVWVGKIDNLEVDFVLRTPEGYTQYIQVAQTLQNPETLERELNPFNKISDHHEKMIISMDYETGSFNGVKHVNVIDWLTSRKDKAL